MKISVVIPTMNEEEAIGDVLERCIRALKDFEFEIIVVDNSTDRTPEIAERMGAKVIRGVRGYGNAYITGFGHATGDVIVMLDADGTYDPMEIPKLVEPIANGEAEFVIGSRFKGEILPNSMPWLHKYVGNPILTWIMNRLFGTRISDSHSGMRAIKRSSLQKLNLSCPGMEFASEMIIEAAKSGLKIEEVPITYHPRKGESKLSSFRDGWRHLRFMLLYSPTVLFVIPGVVLLLLGILTMLYVLAFNPLRYHTEVFGALLTVLGIQVFFFGISSKIYSVEAGFSKEDRLTRFFSRYSILEEGIVAGLIIAIAGGFIWYYILKEWIKTGFGKLSMINLAILAFVLITVGVQIIFNSFFISSLRIKKPD